MQPSRPTKLLAFGIPRMFFIAASRSFVLLFSAFASCALSGCAVMQPQADPSRFYVLTVPSATPERAAEGESKRWKLGLRPVEVPAYLRSKAMAVRTGANEIHFEDFDRWAEPLDQGIGRVMKETLSSARNVEKVALNSHGDDTLDYEMTIRILACEGVRVENGNSSIRFAMTWEARSTGKNSTETKRGVFTADPVAWDGKDYGQLAERLSEAIAGASKALAAGLLVEASPPANQPRKKPNHKTHE
ncbi:MAG: PqiC family protein [Verrucomicrobiia bacterium]